MSYLILNPGNHDQKIYHLNFGENTIGRELDNTITIMYASVSRYHANLIINEDSVTIRDLNSRNSTFVNDAEIDFCELKNGDLIRCGNVVFKFVHTPVKLPPSTLKEDDANIPIVKSLSPDQTRVEIEDLLYQDNPENPSSILRLRQQDTNQRRVDKLKILLEVSKQLSSPDEPERLLEKILDLLFKIMNVDRAVILLVNEETGKLEHKAAKFRSEMRVFRT